MYCYINKNRNCLTIMEFINNKIYIKTVNEPTKYLSTNTFFSGLLSALNLKFDFFELSDNRALWEEFEIIHTGNNNLFYIKSYNNKYISCEKNGDITLKDDRKNWEIFEIIEERSVDEKTYYLIRSNEHDRYLNTENLRVGFTFMDNQEISICSYFNFEIVNPVINDILFDGNYINNLNEKLNHYEKVRERGKPTSRRIKGLIIDIMRMIIEFNNHRSINTDELFSFTQKIYDILKYNNNKSLDNIYKTTINIDKDKLCLLTNTEKNKIFIKIQKYSREYIVILQGLFETYEQDFEEPSLRKRVMDLITIIIALLSLIISIIALKK